LPGRVAAKDLGVTLERHGERVRWTRTLREGEVGGVVLESMAGTPRRVSPGEAQQLADDTTAHNDRFEMTFLYFL